MVKIKSSESFSFDNCQEKNLEYKGSHPMNKNADSADVMSDVLHRTKQKPRNNSALY